MINDRLIIHLGSEYLHFILIFVIIFSIFHLSFFIYHLFNFRKLRKDGLRSVLPIAAEGTA